MCMICDKLLEFITLYKNGPKETARLVHVQWTRNIISSGENLYPSLTISCNKLEKFQIFCIFEEVVAVKDDHK